MSRLPLASAGSPPAVPEPAAELPATAALAPRPVERLLRMKGDLRLGLPVLLQDGHAAVLVALAEALTDDRYRALHALGPAELVLTRRRAEALELALPPGDGPVRLAVPDGADPAWVALRTGQAPTGGAGLPPEAAAVPEPGTPLQHVALELARAMHALPAVVTVSIAAAAAPPELTAMSRRALAEALQGDRTHAPVSAAWLPTVAAEAGRVHVFRPDDGSAEHYAVEVGRPDPAEPVLVRLHSACFTGDVLGSLKCDCGPQLHAAMAAMGEGGGGVLLYLAQEGRGIGLANKLRAYALQEAGLDTVEANHWLGFDDDQRDFRIGAQLLQRLGIDRVRLLTNNPVKVEVLARQGIEVVERVPLWVGRGAQNERYLATKAAKSGHLP
jgi:GTP cyclohydrolase II